MTCLSLYQSSANYFASISTALPWDSFRTWFICLQKRKYQHTVTGKQYNGKWNKATCSWTLWIWVDNPWVHKSDLSFVKVMEIRLPKSANKGKKTHHKQAWKQFDGGFKQTCGISSFCRTNWIQIRLKFSPLLNSNSKWIQI